MNEARTRDREKGARSAEENARSTEENARSAEENARSAEENAPDEFMERFVETLARWSEESAKAREAYPDFDFDTEFKDEATGPQFRALLDAGLDVETAYKAVHIDELIAGSMKQTAERIREKTVNDIRARGARPAENGTGANAPAVTGKRSPDKMTKQEREEIARRVLRGERITF